ncbi:putative acyl- dehydrogenase protein [Neofusicoccum parvum UCRNP2]|uniref:Putative acyl-dehydrogenase protein n=1 Tax=Botryosphaeria parva (strain UCR-NP2) TaxID=1287680 RepID=R1GK54_BOTPV|nr:putative acyl- dehydrogenase protein [Neofusicoccum parvum UCRNP2]
MPIDFTLTPAQEALKASARQFATSVLAPCRERYLKLPTQHERFLATQDAYRQLVEGGWIAMQIPAAHGGTRQSLIDVALVCEEFFAADSSLPITWLVTGLGLAPIFMYGTEAQKKEFLAPFLKREGTPLAALGFSEPTGSANWLQNEGGKGIQTFACIEGDEVVINGGKIWASSSGGWDFQGPDLLCLVCRFGDASSPGPPLSTIGIVVLTRADFTSPANRNGAFAVTSDIETHGFRAHSGPRTRFTDFRVPARNILAHAGRGALVNVAAFTESAALVGAGAAGLMRSCFNRTLAVCTTDKCGGAAPTVAHQSVADLLVSMKARQETTRYLTWKACHYLDTAGEAELAYVAKVYGSEAAVQCVLEGMQAVGVSAYDAEQPYVRLLEMLLGTVVEDVSPINLVYHVQITPKSWCNGSDRCFIAQNGAKQEVYVDWDASGKPRKWVGIPGTIRNLDVDVTFRCEAPAGAALCAWMRTPYKEYAVVDWVPGTPEMPRGHPVGKQMSMRAPSSTGIFEVYCVVGEDNCRGEGDGYFQYDGLDEYHWHW